MKTAGKFPRRFSNIHSNIIFPSTPRSSQWSFLWWGFPTTSLSNSKGYDNLWSIVLSWSSNLSLTIHSTWHPVILPSPAVAILPASPYQLNDTKRPLPLLSKRYQYPTVAVSKCWQLKRDITVRIKNETLLISHDRYLSLQEGTSSGYSPRTAYQEPLP